MKVITMLKIITLPLSISFSFASSMSVDRYEYKCSNQKHYDVLRFHSYSGTEGTWELLAFCKKGILKETYYNGRDFSIEENYPDIKRCTTKRKKGSLKRCYKEFIENNGEEGSASYSLPDIKHFDGSVGLTCQDNIDRFQSNLDYHLGEYNKWEKYYNERGKQLIDEKTVYSLLLGNIQQAEERIETVKNECED